ncbi:MAG: hypothetical protein ABSG03_27560 [Bryobacteraceae bacterium]
MTSGLLRSGCQPPLHRMRGPARRLFDVGYDMGYNMGCHPGLVGLLKFHQLPAAVDPG